MRHIRFFKKLRRDRKGNVLVLTAVAMPILIGFAGLATDTIQWTLDKRQLQRTADSAAMAGAFAISQGKDATTNAEDDIGRTNEVTLYSAAVIENAPTVGAYAGNNDAVRVVLQTQRNLPFSGLFLANAPIIEVEATAAMLSNGNYCVISLDPSTTTGVTAIGNATLDLNCGMFANSTGGNAVVAGGSGRVRSTPVAATGGIPPSTAYIGDTELLPYSNPQPDPFEDIPDPDTSTCNGASPQINVNPNATPATYGPLPAGGTQCYKSISINGPATLRPGVYVIDGGNLSFGAQADVTGDNVVFILTSRNVESTGNVGGMSMNGGASIHLSGRDPGESYEGILVYQDRRADIGGNNHVNGDSSSYFEGAFYFPREEITFNGTSGMTTDCVQFVGFRVNFSGTTSIANNCTVGTLDDDFKATVVRLVG